MDTFYSHGKLLLTGEYAVLDGALALAIPTRMGQFLYCHQASLPGIHWKSFDPQGKLWFEAILQWENGKLASENSSQTTETLVAILHAAKALNPEFLSGSGGWEVLSNLEFPRNWGLGSSSTLINNIASWAKVDAFTLLKNSFGGSGYDIAAAQNSSPILYQWQQNTPRTIATQLSWPFKEELFFVHLNQKQDSKEGIAHYRSNKKDLQLIEDISALTKRIASAIDLSAFEALLEEHEARIAKAVNLPTVKEARFADYPGSLKSLGAWGGDFILATGPKAYKEYFIERGYTTLHSFNEMIL